MPFNGRSREVLFEVLASYVYSTGGRDGEENRVGAGYRVDAGKFYSKRQEKPNQTIYALVCIYTYVVLFIMDPKNLAKQFMI